jgi:hypothetical protein
MPTYVQKSLPNTIAPKCLYIYLYQPISIKYGKKYVDVAPEIESPPLDKEGNKYEEHVLGSYFYYGREIEMAIIQTFSKIVSKQAKPTQGTCDAMCKSTTGLHAH